MINTKNILTVDDATTISDNDTLFVGQNSQLKQIDYDLLADAILNKISSKSYSELDTTAKTLIGAIDELNGKSNTIPDRFYMTIVNSETHKKINIAFKSNARNFIFVFGSANQDPYVGVADIKAINDISDVNGVVSLERGDTPNSYVINCPSWSTFFIVGDKNYLGQAEITYSD